MERCIGLDVGYGFIKVTDGHEGFVFPSVVGDGNPGVPLRLGFDQPAVTDDIRLTVDGRMYFVGNLAIRQSRLAYRGLSATRAEGNDIKVLFLSALSLFCQDPLSRFSVVTGLPPGRMHLVDDLVGRLRGEHHVARHSGQVTREMTIRIDQIHVVPQPLGAYWAQVLDKRGQLREGATLAEGRVGIVDIGFRTSDFVAVADGEYVPDWSRTVPIGLATAYDEISAQLSTQYGLERAPYALDSSVIAGFVNIAGRRVDITELRDRAFADVATKLLVELQSLWQLAEYDQVLLTGGGGPALEKYLLSHMPQGVVVEDPMTANSRGYLAWAYRLLGAQTHAAAQDPAPTHRGNGAISGASDADPDALRDPGYPNE